MFYFFLFFVEQKQFNFLTICRLKGTLDNVTVTDLQKFELDYVHLVLIPVTFSINMTLPSLVAKGSYDADGNLAGVLPVFGKGEFE